MTITIQNEASISGIGIHNNRNSQGLYCITDNKAFVSQTDTAKHYNTHVSNVSHALNNDNGQTTCKGKRFCRVSELHEHMEEIIEAREADRTEANAKIATLTAQVKTLTHENESLQAQMIQQESANEQERDNLKTIIYEQEAKIKAQEHLIRRQRRIEELRKALQEETELFEKEFSENY